MRASSGTLTLSGAYAVTRSAIRSKLRRARRNSSFGYRAMRSEWNMYMIS